MPNFSDEFLRAIPKTDLHLHLDGSLRIETLIDLARDAGVALPANDVMGLRETVFKDHYASLEEYLRGFALTTAVMQTDAALFRVAYELMLDNAAEGVRYIEVRFAPQLLMSERMSYVQVMDAVDRGLRTARDELNAKLAAGEPEYDYGIIVCAMRFCLPVFSSYYAQFWKDNAGLSDTQIIQKASVELARATVELHAGRRDDSSTGAAIQVVGFDIAGAENGFPASRFTEAYALAGRAFLGKTVHAGEAYGAESIYQAVTQLHAERIGHGLFLFDEARLQDDRIADRHAYLEALIDFIAKRRIALEVCLSSNLQTTPALSGIAAHPFRTMLERGLAVALCTDNRLVSNTTVCKEYRLAVEHFPVDAKRLKTLAMTGFERAFHFRPYAEKLDYLKRVSAHYDMIARQHGVAIG